MAPAWVMETMPVARVMGDMVLLPNSDVLIVNGAGSGTAGWELARGPVLTPVIYHPGDLRGGRFELQAAATTPSLYHSTAVLLRDTRVLISGSNPHVKYNFSGVEYPTDLSLEAFSPSYLGQESSGLRPRVVVPQSPLQLGHGARFGVRFTAGTVSEGGCAGDDGGAGVCDAFLVDESEAAGAGERCGGGGRRRVAVAPDSEVLAPSGYYMVFVVNGGVPSEGVWAHIR